MTLTQTADRAALIEELALMLARHRISAWVRPRRLRTSAVFIWGKTRRRNIKGQSNKSNAAPAMTLTQTADRGASAVAGERPRSYFDKVRARNRATGSGIRASLE